MSTIANKSCHWQPGRKLCCCNRHLYSRCWRDRCIAHKTSDMLSRLCPSCRSSKDTEDIPCCLDYLNMSLADTQCMLNVLENSQRSPENKRGSCPFLADFDRSLRDRAYKRLGPLRPHNSPLNKACKSTVTLRPDNSPWDKIGRLRGPRRLQRCRVDRHYRPFGRRGWGC